MDRYMCRQKALLLGLNICTGLCVYSQRDTRELEIAVIGVFRRLTDQASFEV